ncbi:autotransporter assembly complex protein TamA [Salinibius halmophilus]|uniref:autotransporter assembly complex protein TamA n=1 Tax=Salinibius halmophilus TaxID=1853216 RepID=UPI000E670D75|nr:BamA/TamA family outer membrane protein [Salinibius halmophilus]
MWQRCAFIILLSVSAFAWASEVPNIRRDQVVIDSDDSQLQNQVFDDLKRYRKALQATGIAPDLNRLASGERERVIQLLAAQGYYRPSVSYRIVEPGNDEAFIEYDIRPGARYVINEITVQGQQPRTNDWQRVKTNTALITEEVLSEQTRLNNQIASENCFFTVNVRHEVRLNHNKQTATATYIVNAQDPSRIGRITFADGAGVSNEYLLQQTGLRQGACFQRSDIEQSVLNLYQTNLFASIQRKLTRQGDGSVDVHYQFIKRSPRTLNASTGWDSTESFNLKLGWEHRNLFGYAQWLTLENELQFSMFEGFNLRKSVSDITLTLPGFQAAPNTLILATTYTFEQLEQAQDLDQIHIVETSATLNRQASRRETYRYSIALRRTDERIAEAQRTVYQTLRFPASYVIDDNPNNFNPSSGNRIRLQVEPVVSIREDGYSFFRTQFGWSNYQSLGRSIVFATDSRWRSIWTDAQDSTRIPESDRFRLGGGGSIRGYQYQSIGSDQQATPGLQSFRATTELRGRFNDNWGMTLFADAGNIADAPSLLFDNTWSYGAGIGLRYFTAFAPIRVDVAVPISSDETLDPYQLYISLGQAF